MFETLITGDERMRARALQLVLAAVAALAVVAAFGQPGQESALLTVAAAALLTAVGVRWADRPRRSMGWHAGLGATTILVTVVAVLGEGGTVSTAAALLYPWIGLHAALFLPSRGAGAHLALAAGGYGAALWLVGMRTPVVAWVALVVTLVAVAGTVGWLTDQTRHLAQTDPLTGAANRRFWEHTVSHERARATRSDNPLCVAVVSIDGFREYAYERGHAAADLLLQEAMEAWMRRVRGGDLIGRLRADEFGVLLPECGVSVARLVTDRLRDATPDGKTCSAGIAMWDGDEPPDVLINRAAAALRVAQRAGRAQSFVAAA